VLSQVSLQLEQQEEQQLFQEQKCRVPVWNPKRSSLRELRILLPAPKTLRGQVLPAPQHQLALRQFLEQLPSSQRLSWQEPSLQVLRHQQEQYQLSSQQLS
jgi:hypothetical protein